MENAVREKKGKWCEGKGGEGGKIAESGGWADERRKKGGQNTKVCSLRLPARPGYRLTEQFPTRLAQTLDRDPTVDGLTVRGWSKASTGSLALPLFFIFLEGEAVKSSGGASTRYLLNELGAPAFRCGSLMLLNLY